MQWLYEDFLKMPENVYRRFLLEQAYRGTISKPLDADTVADAVAQLKSTPGSVAALPLSAAVGGIKFLRIVE